MKHFTIPFPFQHAVAVISQAAQLSPEEAQAALFLGPIIATVAATPAPAPALPTCVESGTEKQDDKETGSAPTVLVFTHEFWSPDLPRLCETVSRMLKDKGHWHFFHALYPLARKEGVWAGVCDWDAGCPEDRQVS